MVRGSGARTLTQEVYTQLRADILAGRLKPGQRLKLADLSARYGASLSVVREALTRLAEQRLARSSPQQGFIVTPLSIEDLSDLTSVRVDIESLTLRRAIERGDIAWEAQVVAAHHTLERIPQAPDDDPAQVREEWMTAHTNFHQALLAGCNSPRLFEVACSLRDAAELYQHWSRSLGHDEDRDVPEEHRALLHATLDRDTERALATLSDHIRRTSAALLPPAGPETGPDALAIDD